MGIKKRPVHITITGTQFFSSEEQLLSSLERFLSGSQDTSVLPTVFSTGKKRSVELCTSGELCVKNGGIEIAYEESEITGMPNSRTLFRIEKNGLVTLSRQGRTKTNLVFEHGKRHMLFSSSAGTPSVCVSCHKMNQKISALGGSLDIDYTVEVGGAVAEHNAYTIRVDL